VCVRVRVREGSQRGRKGRGGFNSRIVSDEVNLRF